ncbi:MAG: M48 family metallopeptidase [Bacilli bacterium]
MHKWTKWLIGAFLVYGIAVLSYVYLFADYTLPENMRNTAVDPTTFMTAEQLANSTEYSKIKYLFMFLSEPIEWLVIALLLLNGVGHKIERFVRVALTRPFLQLGAFFTIWSVLIALLDWPLQWLSYQIANRFGVSVQSFSSWMRDWVVDFWIGLLVVLPIVFVLHYLLLRQPRRWPFSLWIISIPFTLFLVFIQPVVIDPLYERFVPIENEQLETKILALAQQAEIPAEHVYQVNKAEKTTALNAYVTGIGSNSRIVLWDTTLAALDEDEVLFVMAHEMAHYVKKHIYWNLAIGFVVSLLGLFCAQWMGRKILKKSGRASFAQYGFSSIPLIFLALSVLSFAFQPVDNAFSRYHERESDAFAIELTNDTEGAVSAFQKLSSSSLSDVYPPFLVRKIFYAHPSVAERIRTLSEIETEE